MARIAHILAKLMSVIVSVQSVKESSGNARIVGGTAATPGRYQYFVDVVVSPVVGNSFICGGALIHSDIVLTAAQCYREGGTISVRVNASTRTDGIQRTAQRMVPHPQYKLSFGYDVMVLKLNEKVAIQPVTYNTESSVPIKNQILTIFGFGTSSETDNTASQQLMEVDVFTGDFNECNLQYEFNLDSSLHLCTIGPLEGGKDACDGDGGAPLIVKGINTATDVVVGIVSFGNGCARSDSYSGNSKTAGYADWVKGQICALSSNIPSDCPNSMCFSGSTVVHILGRGPAKLSEVEINDKVMVGSNKYEPVYSFGHYSPDSQAKFLEISTSTSTLQVSRDHLVFVNNRQAVPASLIRVGDEVIDGTGSKVFITSIKNVVATGVFAPFTPSGTIVVDDILASSYVAFEDSAFITMGGVHISYHWLSHAFEFPHRVWCYYLKTCPTETYAANGISLWVGKPHTWAQRLLGQHALFRTSGLAVLFTTLILSNLLEQWWGVILCVSFVLFASRKPNSTSRVKVH